MHFFSITGRSENRVLSGVAAKPVIGSDTILEMNMRGSRWIILLLLLIGIAGVWWYLHRPSVSTLRENPAQSQGQAQHPQHRGDGSGPMGAAGAPVPVIGGTVKKQDVPIYFNGIGTVQAYNTVTVRVRVDGQIKEIDFKEGQEVKTGDLLAVIDPAPYQAVYDQALGKRAQDQAQLDNAKVVFQRDSELLAKNVLDHQTYDTAKFQVDQFEALVKSDDANIESAKVNLDYTRVTSPILGRVGIRLVDVGNIVHASDSNGIVTITQLKPISVLFTLPQQQLNQVNQEAAKGPLKVFAVDRDNTNPLSEGVLAVVNNQIDQTTGTIQLKATFSNEDQKLWPGQFVNARLLVTTRKDGFVVPASVIQRGPNGSFAYVIKPDQTVEMRPVTVDQINNGLALIDEGLQEGEQVVVDGQYKLQPGSKIILSAPGNSPQRIGELRGSGQNRPGGQKTAASDETSGAQPQESISGG
jgi:membrane fusion protein, multidrug efflux system